MLLLSSAQNWRATETDLACAPPTSAHDFSTPKSVRQGRAPILPLALASSQMPWLLAATITHRFIFALPGSVLNSPCHLLECLLAIGQLSEVMLG